jgi:hypothetical protein
MSTEPETKRPSWELPNAVWQRMEPLIPPKTGTEGHPRTVHRRRLTEAIFSGLRPGSQGPAWPRARLGPPRTVSSYCAPGVRAGVLAQVWAEALAVSDELKGLDWTWQRVEGATPTAPGGGKPRAPIPRPVASAGRRAVCGPMAREAPWR